MTWRDLLIGVGVGALALAALALAFAIRAIVRRARAGKRRVWFGLVGRGALIAGLVALGVLAVRVPPPPPNLVNQPAPVAEDAIVAFVRPSHVENRDTLVGVSARTGKTLWMRTFNYNISTLMRPLPGVILVMASACCAHTYTNNGLIALRATDGATLWSHLGLTSRNGVNLVATDGGQVFVEEDISGGTAFSFTALDARTGRRDWITQAPATTLGPESMIAGEGSVFVTGQALLTDQNAWGPARVLALGEADGSLKWVAPTPLNPTNGVSYLVAQGNLIGIPLSEHSGPVTALRESNGSTAWSAALGMGADNPATIYAATTDGDHVYVMAAPSQSDVGAHVAPVSPPATLVALDAGTGALRWRVSISAVSDSWSLAVSDGVLLSGVSLNGSRADVGFNPSGSLLTAYDAASGRALWRDNTPPTGVSWDLPQQLMPQGDGESVYLEGIQADPYIQDNLLCPIIYCPGLSWLYAVNVQTGAPWWRARMGKITLKQLAI